MQAYQAGDSLAFETLYLRSSPRLYGYLRKKLGSSPELDDVFQQVLLKLHRTRHAYDPRYRFEQWLFVIARTTVLDHFRKNRRTESLLQEQWTMKELGRGADAEAPDREVRLDGLTEVQRQVVEQKVVEELPYEEIAARLQRSEESVRQLFSRAIRKLRKSNSPELKLKGDSRS